jgi:hypothetical protein
MRGGVRSAQTGLEHSSSCPSAVAALDRLQTELLCYGLDAAVVFRAVGDDPAFGAAQALGGAMHLFTMSPEGAVRAAPYVAAAQALASSANPRERLLVAAIVHWADGRTDSAIAAHMEIAHRWPRDLISARICQVHLLNKGDFAGMRRLTTLLLSANPDVPHVRGMHAFALEQTGETAAAERLGREAADAAFDPWAEHAVAHALERAGRPADGLAFLRPRSDGWSRCSSFLLTHNWWHTALFHLDLGEGDAALDLYDSRVWGVRKAYCQDQANAVSLLARLELHGVPVGNRWIELGSWLQSRTSEHVNGFLDLHYAYGLARAGADAEVDALLNSLARRAATTEDPVWRDIMPAAAQGLVLHARGRPTEAAERLGRILPHLYKAGGSSTQQDLFRVIHLDALAGSTPAAARLGLAARIAERGTDAWTRRLEARLQLAA